MNRRKVKKFSRIARHQPERLKNYQLNYLMRSWRTSFRQLSPVQQYSIAKAMELAFGFIDFAKFVFKKHNMPFLPSGGIPIRGELGQELIINSAGNMQVVQDNTPMKPGERFTINGKEFNVAGDVE